jgi:Holliday junction resolvase RusA-like endonuclease
MAVILAIPGKPRGKGSVRTAYFRKDKKTGQKVPLPFPMAYKDDETEDYMATVRLVAQRAMQGDPPADEPLRVDVSMFFLVPKSWSAKKRKQALLGQILPGVKPDFDNVFKGLCDACKGIVFRDDALLAQGSWSKFYAEHTGVLVRFTRSKGGETIGRAIERWIEATGAQSEGEGGEEGNQEAGQMSAPF